LRFLQWHMKVHTGERCLKSTSNNPQSGKKSLRKEPARNTGETPLTCSFCPKSFPMPSMLQIHQRIHTGEKPYSCSQCSRSFSASGNLQVHMRTHSGEKPYKCSQCRK